MPKRRLIDAIIFESNAATQCEYEAIAIATDCVDWGNLNRTVFGEHREARNVRRTRETNNSLRKLTRGHQGTRSRWIIICI